MKAWNPGKFAQAALASLLIALVLLISVVAASPSLHELIHADAGDANHHCAATEFIKGQVDSVAVAPLILGLVILFGGVSLLAETFLWPLADYRFSASRAPPV
jgi:hypothetical protein